MSISKPRATTTRDPRRGSRARKTVLRPHESGGAAAAKTTPSKPTPKTKPEPEPLPRGITVRPSGKWQVQVYYAGKSRYLGVYRSRQDAAEAYRRARERADHFASHVVPSPEQIKTHVQVMRRAAGMEGGAAGGTRQGSKDGGPRTGPAGGKQWQTKGMVAKEASNDLPRKDVLGDEGDQGGDGVASDTDEAPDDEDEEATVPNKMPWTEDDFLRGLEVLQRRVDADDDNMGATIDKDTCIEWTRSWSKKTTMGNHGSQGGESDEERAAIPNTGRWTDDEHRRFLRGLQLHGRGNWKAIARYVPSRTPEQVRKHRYCAGVVEEARTGTEGTEGGRASVASRVAGRDDDNGGATRDKDRRVERARCHVLLRPKEGGRAASDLGAWKTAMARGEEGKGGARKTTDPLSPKGSQESAKPKRIRPKCSAGGCPNIVVLGGVCVRHGAKRKRKKMERIVQKEGDAPGPAKPKRSRRTCTVEGCSNQRHHAGGRCKRHRNVGERDGPACQESGGLARGESDRLSQEEGLATQDAIGSAKPKRVRPTCAVEGCPNQRQSVCGGRCKRHRNGGKRDGRTSRESGGLARGENDRLSQKEGLATPRTADGCAVTPESTTRSAGARTASSPGDGNNAKKGKRQSGHALLTPMNKNRLTMGDTGPEEAKEASIGLGGDDGGGPKRARDAVKDAAKQTQTPKPKKKSVWVRVPPGALGLSLELSSAVGGGALIKGIKPECPVRTQLRIDDVLVAIDGKAITARGDFGGGKDRSRLFQIEREIDPRSKKLAAAPDPSYVPILDLETRRKSARPVWSRTLQKAACIEDLEADERNLEPSTQLHGNATPARMGTNGDQASPLICPATLSDGKNLSQRRASSISPDRGDAVDTSPVNDSTLAKHKQKHAKSSLDENADDLRAIESKHDLAQFREDTTTLLLLGTSDCFKVYGGECE